MASRRSRHARRIGLVEGMGQSNHKGFQECGLIGLEILGMQTRATTKGQIVIPVILRRKYGIKAGTRMIVSDNGESILLKPITEQYLKKLQGSLKGKGGLGRLMNERYVESR